MKAEILGKKHENFSELLKQRITIGDTTTESDTCGLRFDKGYVIRHTHIAYGNAKLVVHNRNFVLIEGLSQLLLKRVPQHYEPEDLVAYKNILKLTNAHKKLYKTDMPMNANNS
ncbi:hypothetical protein JTB14_028108 [Gonioctena quinquepunctata]|nr:hypothetical protein JTB14_028108 [Gonioctena quinquepunctata]